jgi:hypothetical protein
MRDFGPELGKLSIDVPLRGLPHGTPSSRSNGRDGRRDACVSQTLKFRRLPLELFQDAFGALKSFFSVFAFNHGDTASIAAQRSSDCTLLNR